MPASADLRTAPRRVTGAGALALTAGLWGAGVVVPLAALAHITALAAVVAPLLGLWALAFPVLVDRARLADPRWLGYALVGAGLAIGLVSFATGWFNGLTDEPYMMPHFGAVLLAGRDPYSTSITVTYVQYGRSFTDTATYVYLPVLLVLQPFVVSYKLYALLAWLAAALLLRGRPIALVAVGQPYLALLAASGFNDFPVLLLLTLAIVGVAGRRQRWAEVLALGAKQFANVLLVAYYLLRRQPKRALVAVGVSVAWVLPFLVWAPRPFVCQAVLLWPDVCGANGSSSVLSHLNYWVWPVWALGVFFEPIRSFVRQHGPSRWRAHAAPAAAPEPGAAAPGAAPAARDP